MHNNNYFTDEEQEIYDLTVSLLHAIRTGDVERYTALCSSKLTCIEPESNGQIIHGLPFHLFFLSNSSAKEYHFEVINPIVRVYSDSAFISYALIENKFADGKFALKTVYETRIYQKEDMNWKLIHFHRNN